MAASQEAPSFDSIIKAGRLQPQPLINTLFNTAYFRSPEETKRGTRESDPWKEQTGECAWLGSWEEGAERDSWKSGQQDRGNKGKGHCHIAYILLTL